MLLGTRSTCARLTLYLALLNPSQYQSAANNSSLSLFKMKSDPKERIRNSLPPFMNARAFSLLQMCQESWRLMFVLNELTFYSLQPSSNSTAACPSHGERNGEFTNRICPLFCESLRQTSPTGCMREDEKEKAKSTVSDWISEKKCVNPYGG